jgi:cell division protein FtsI/penicillin-binding protein 2
MSNQSYPRKVPPARASWRDYQARLKHAGNHRRKFRRLGIIVAGIAVAVCGFYGAFGVFNSTACHKQDQTDPPSRLIKKTITKRDVRILLEQTPVINRKEKRFQLAFGDSHFSIETTLDIALQTYLAGQLDRVNSRYIGIVAMDPDDGRILAMVGFDKTDSAGNPCISNRFPAASIFKIVTAAAAVERRGYGPHTRINFNGYKHTLYKSQLKEQKNRYTNSIAFKDSFAQSVNPVFGKIGSLYLKKEGLADYAQAFGFNREFAFEIPLPTSHFEISDDPYHWAEIASGFNRQTTLSPVHAAMVAAMLLNHGDLVEPTIIQSIDDSMGNRIYQSRPQRTGPVIGTRAIQTVDKLMQTTITSGTGRKAFRGHRRDRVLAKLHMGGKTGSIYNRSHDARFDWFVGYAREKNGEGQLAVAVVVAHEEYIGKRASQYARILFKEFFKNRFAKTKADPTSKGKS